MKIVNHGRPESNKISNIMLFEKSHSAIPIELEIENEWLFNSPITDLSQAFNIAQEKILKIRETSEKAFLHKNKESWKKIQNILYLWNVDDINRHHILNDYRHILKTILRNEIIKVEMSSRPFSTLYYESNFAPENAVKELSEIAHSHRINSHPLLLEMNKHGISFDEIKIFMNNYYVNNRLFHLFIAAISFFTPLERRTELANNFYDELGSGDNSLAHPLLFLKNYNTIQKPSKIVPFPESLYLTNTKLHAAFLSGDYHYAMGGFGFIELTMPDQMIKILNGLRKSNIPEKDLEFWRVHITIDVEHGKAWFEEMRELITTPEEAQACLNGGLALLEARAVMYDGIWNAINK